MVENNEQNKSESGTKPDTSNVNTNQGEMPETFEAFLEKQPESVKQQYAEHTSGLKSALEKERENNKKLNSELKKIAEKAEKDSETQKQLIEITNRLTESERRSRFYELAHAKGVSNVRLAFTQAQTDNLLDDSGNVDWDKFKADYPELFGSQKPKIIDAGSGAGQQPPKKFDMNEWIRRGGK